MKEAATKNRLNVVQNSELYLYVKSKWESSDKNITKFAEQATKDLGFTVTYGNAYGMLGQMHLLVKKETDLQSRFNILLEEVVNLHKILDEPLSEKLQSIL